MWTLAKTRTAAVDDDGDEWRFFLVVVVERVTMKTRRRGRRLWLDKERKKTMNAYYHLFLLRLVDLVDSRSAGRYR